MKILRKGHWTHKSHTAFHMDKGDDHSYFYKFSLFIHSFCIKTLTRETAEPSFSAAGWSATFLYWSGAAEKISFLRGKSAGTHYQVVIQSDDGGADHQAMTRFSSMIMILVKYYFNII